jgi:hypothetical protein
MAVAVQRYQRIMYGMLPEIVREINQRIVDKAALTCCSQCRM